MKGNGRNALRQIELGRLSAKEAGSRLLASVDARITTVSSVQPGA